MNSVQSDHSRILAKKLAHGQPLSAADYQLIQSLIEQVLGADELREVVGTVDVGKPTRRSSTPVQ